MKPADLPLLAPCLAALAFFLAACSGEATVVVAKPAVPVVWEIERNDEAWQANDLGALEPYDALELRGAIGDDGLDPYDGFAFRAQTPLRLRFELVPLDGADLDLHLYDPWHDAFVASWDCGCASEHGTIDVPAGAEFQLVVAAWSGKSRWSLRLAVEPLDQLQALQAPALRGVELALPPLHGRVVGYAPADAGEDDAPAGQDAGIEALAAGYALDALGRVRPVLAAFHGTRLLLFAAD